MGRQLISHGSRLHQPNHSIQMLPHETPASLIAEIEPYQFHVTASRILPSSIGLDWVLLDFTGFYWVLLGFTGFYWILLDFTGFYLVLLGFTGFYWVLLGFTEFYWLEVAPLASIHLLAPTRDAGFPYCRNWATPVPRIRIEDLIGCCRVLLGFYWVELIVAEFYWTWLSFTGFY